MSRTSLEPLRFERRVLEKVWGGRALATNPGFELPPDVPVGETWEVVDRADENSVVAEGVFQGRSLGELMREHGAEILGDARPNAQGRFPLLVKYIDASQNLSVQVHPDDATAAALGGGAEAKTEAWYIVDVAPGGALYLGLKPEVTPEQFAAGASTKAVVDMMQRWDVRPGDCVLVPGGTVHAIGAGVTLLEVQQNSDTTYRIWDWDRVGLDGKPRETHVEQALRCVRFGDAVTPPAGPTFPSSDGVRRASLARSPYFAIDALELDAECEIATHGRFRMQAVLAGEGTLRHGNGWSRELHRGDVWLIPAACDAVSLHPRGLPLRIVELLDRA